MLRLLAAAGLLALSCRTPPAPRVPRGLSPVAVAGCFNEEVFAPRCSGAALDPEDERPRPLATFCHRCLEDRHCADRPEGRCLILSDLDACGHGLRVCAYPGDTCYPPARCPGGQSCYLDDGRAFCSEPPPPNP